MWGMERTASRRRFLTTIGATGATVLTGCASGGRSGPTSGTATQPRAAGVREIAYDGRHLVVRLEDGHSVSRVNLIAPDGSPFGHERVPEGATTVRIEILDIEPNVGGYEHYTPGTYELVAVRDDGSTSMTVEMVPELRIVDVRQYRAGEQASDYAKLAVAVENTGTAPTWVYDVKTRDAPNFAANVSLGDDPGVLHLEHPTNPGRAIIPPGETRTYVGPVAPLLFVNSDDPECNGTYEMVVLVGPAVGESLEQPIRTTVEGEVKSVGLTGEYVCTNVSVELIEQ